MIHVFVERSWQCPFSNVSRPCTGHRTGKKMGRGRAAGRGKTQNCKLCFESVFWGAGRSSVNSLGFSIFQVFLSSLHGARPDWLEGWLAGPGQAPAKNAPQNEFPKQLIFEGKIVASVVPFGGWYLGGWAPKTGCQK